MVLAAAALAAVPGCDDSQLVASRYVKRLLVSAGTGGIIESGPTTAASSPAPGW